MLPILLAEVADGVAVVPRPAGQYAIKKQVGILFVGCFGGRRALRMVAPGLACMPFLSRLRAQGG